VVEGIGVVGDPASVPWLIRKMEDPLLARPAGAALPLITGADLAYPNLDRAPPRSTMPAGLDEDDGLPRPQPAALQAWLLRVGAQYPAGARSFMGGVPDLKQCRDVLRLRRQQRWLAAMG
jgi:hypothetical protein